MKKSEDEVLRLLDEVNDRIESGSTYAGMTYEEGVKAALEWAYGFTDESVFDE
jgi:hypothetical protein